MKIYGIIYNNGRWNPRKCEVIKEFDDGDSIVEYLYCGETKKARISKRYTFLTYEAAKAFCYHFNNKNPLY